MCHRARSVRVLARRPRRGGATLSPRALAALALLLAGCASSADLELVDLGAMPGALTQPDPIVETTSGPVRGTRGEGSLEFLGIPYAAPPVGELRFRPPEEHPGWDEPLDATVRGPACTQEFVGMALGEEACLVVNVHTPSPPPREPASVMVWIHGGSFVFGEGIQLDRKTRGDRLAAEHGVVVVSMNYRLGPLGFLAHPALSAESGGSGNWGLLDQIAALRWVQDNVAAFGGDPEDVTIFGESAGGQSVCLLLVSPDARGLYHRAISQSGLCDMEIPTLAEAERRGEDLAVELGCVGPDAAACLREVPAAKLAAGMSAGSTVDEAVETTFAWWPNVDGRVVPATFREGVEAGEVHDVETIVGWNGDEGTLFIVLAELEGFVVDEAVYRDGLALLAERHGLETEEVEAAYPVDAYDDAAAALADAVGDALLACPSRRAARILAERVPTRVYHFAYPDAFFQFPPERDMGAFHSAEIQYVFGHPALIGDVAFAGEELELHRAISGYWTRFAASGEPAGQGAPAWPLYDPEEEPVLVLDREIRVETGVDRDRCALWDGGSP